MRLARQLSNLEIDGDEKIKVLLLRINRLLCYNRKIVKITQYVYLF